MYMCAVPLSGCRLAVDYPSGVGGDFSDLSTIVALSRIELIDIGGEQR